ncbi:MAG: hypothetical protein GY797_02915 [Deltaproteobacteria bacterium]|nr:hypothetical protein [Deltaproteobacteria bacterium]
MRNQVEPPEIVSAFSLLDTLFTKILDNAEEFNPEVVALTKEHLGCNSPHSKAGSNLAKALIDLAKERAWEE